MGPPCDGEGGGERTQFVKPADVADRSDVVEAVDAVAVVADHGAGLGPVDRPDRGGRADRGQGLGHAVHVGA